MARCSCNGQTCGCVIVAGDGISTEGSGTAANPLVISAEGGGGGGGGGWLPGDYKAVAYANTPAGWLEANGQAVSRSTYADLFTAIGTMYGAGNGSTTFNVPDLRDRSMIGASGTKPLASIGGSAETTLVPGNLPAHAHSINHDHPSVNTSSAGGHDHALTHADGVGGSTLSIPRGNNVDNVQTGGAIATNGAHVHSVNVPAYVGNSGDGPGLSAPFSNQPPYRAARYLIKT